ncbi:hypothetical protein [Spiroplasma endosymbiont of Polydrusus pterygomalis]|uniref:hypothetical protein n=1 Tax=Spiroplasma endosymbiont of Polydrusus pterygomalis TaxID=3139327 RepID=UPI003CCB2E4F
MANLKLNNQIKNITYPFYLKGNDFKELSLKALPIKNWIDNHGQELAEFIYRHLNHYALNSYRDVNLKDVKSSISKVDYVFREPLELIKNFKDELNRIRVNIINLEKVLQNNKIEIKNSLIQVQYLKQQQFIQTKKQEQENRVEYANNLTPDMGLDMDQIEDEQVRVMEDVAKIEQDLEKTTSKFRKEKILIKDIDILGVNDDFLQNADKLELINLIKNYLIVDEQIVKNEIKKQWDSNKNINTIGVNGIKLKINKGEK